MNNTSASIKPSNDKLQTFYDDLSKQIKILTWVVGIIMAISIFIIARK